MKSMQSPEESQNESEYLDEMHKKLKINDIMSKLK